MTEVIHELWSRGEEVDEVVDSYTFLAKSRELDNYRFFTVASLQFSGLPYLPDHVRTFIKDRPRVLGIANIVHYQGYRMVVSIVFRDLKQKDFCTYSIFSGLPYGLGTFQSFKFGDPLVIVEGLKDRDSLVQICPNTIALCGSSMGKIMRSILLTVTNRFVLLYDNDETGVKQKRRDKIILEKEGCQVLFANHPEGHKDAGEITDLLYLGDFSTSEYLQSYHKSQLSVLGVPTC